MIFYEGCENWYNTRLFTEDAWEKTQSALFVATRSRLYRHVYRRNIIIGFAMIILSYITVFGLLLAMYWLITSLS